MKAATSAAAAAFFFVLSTARVKAQGNGNDENDRTLGPARCTLYRVEPYMINATEPHEPKPVCEMDPEYEDGIEGIAYELEGVNSSFYDDVEFAHTSVSISIAARDQRRFIQRSGFKLDVIPGSKVTKEKINQGKGKALRGRGSDRNSSGRRRLAPTLGTSSLLIIYSVPTAGPQNNDVTAAQIANEVFGDLCNDPAECVVDPVNGKSQMMECSRDQLIYVPACGAGSTCENNTDIVNGVLSVNVSDVTGVPSGDVVNWANAAADPILSPAGLSRSSFTQVMHVIPDEASWGGAAAWAYLPGTLSAFRDSYSYRMGIQVHEFGHNIGLHHSGYNGASYADHSCLMGNPSYGDDGPKICWNGAKSWESGWYASDSLSVDPESAPFDGLLIGAADFADNNYTPGEHRVVLQILDQTQSQDYYVMYNRKKGPNGEVNFHPDKVTVTMGKSGQVSWHQAALGTNGEANNFEKFRVSNFKGTAKDLVIKVCSLTAGPPDTAHVLVYVDDGPAYNNGVMCPGEVSCLTDDDCFGGDLCKINSCDVSTNECIAPVDVACFDDGLLCNGEYSCNPSTGNCDFTSGDDLCDDKNPCTDDLCDTNSDSCQNNGIPGCAVPGALIETWTGISGTSVSDLTSLSAYPDSPDNTGILSNGLEAPVNYDDNFGSRVRAYIVPFQSGDYTFYIASDDGGELLLSTSADPTSATSIANVPDWAGSRDWNKFPEQTSPQRSLSAGTAYYIEALYKEGGGGDNLAIAWSSPVNNIAQSVIGPDHVFQFPPVPCTSDIDCMDNNWCTSNTCNIETNLCEAEDISSELCPDDGLVCTGVWTCNPAGSCDFEDSSDLCYDANPCTNDQCDDDPCTNDQCDDAQGGCFNTPIEGCVNGALLETWLGITGVLISDLTGNANYPNSPNETTTLTGLIETPTNVKDNYGSRVRTYLVPPATGNYTFYIASDDQGELLLSTSTDPAQSVSIASVPIWTSSREWNKFPDDQKSDPVSLVKGAAYYLEAIFKEGGGGDNLAIAWESPSNGIPLEVISTDFTTLTEPELPSPSPSAVSSAFPSLVPTLVASELPSLAPTLVPSELPSSAPTTAAPTLVPSELPSLAPSLVPSKLPSSAPTTAAPSSFCNNNGICEEGETCESCIGDCTGTTSGASCGNGRCEGGNGESTTSCVVDCPGKTSGSPSNRWYCGADIDGVSIGHGCQDGRCEEAGYSCTMEPVNAGPTCCGDGTCDTESESNMNCPQDCSLSSPTSAPTVVNNCPPPLSRNKNELCDFSCQCASGNCKGNGRCS